MHDLTEGYASAVAWVRGKYPDYKIVDAAQGTEVEVSAGDIHTGNRKDPFNCAVAHACRRGDGADIAIVIRSTAILLYHRDKRAVRYQLNRLERSIIREYDHTGHIDPCRFWLAPVWPTNRFGETTSRRERYRPSNGNGTKKPVGPVRYLDGVRNWRRPVEISGT